MSLAAEPVAAAAPAQGPQLSQSPEALAVEAYQYFYPLVSMEITRQVLTNMPEGSSPGAGPPNKFIHARALLDGDFKTVVRPNFDTLYSSAWLDLANGPLVVSAPDTGGRYYLLQIMDHWSDVIAAPGSRTSGNKAGAWLLAPPGWRGEVPAGVERIDSPTPIVWIVARTKVDGVADTPAANKVQDGYKVTPLAHWGNPEGAPAPVQATDPAVDVKTPPKAQVDAMPADKYWNLVGKLYSTTPPHATDWSQVQRMRALGLEPGKGFDFGKAPPEVQDALAKAPKKGLGAIVAKLSMLAPVANGWQTNVENVGVYGSNYLRRAAIAFAALGANQPEDAVYPMLLADSGGAKVESPSRYRLSFKKGELPPVDAFWSVTLYNDGGYQVPNPLKRYKLGSADALAANPDGSVDIYVGPDSPGPGKESNWLPAPQSGAVALTMRLYAPRPEILTLQWKPPPVVKY